MLWSDILGVEERTNEVGQLVSLVSLRVRAEISKVRNSRDIITRGGEYIKRLRRILSSLNLTIISFQIKMENIRVEQENSINIGML